MPSSLYPLFIPCIISAGWSPIEKGGTGHMDQSSPRHLDTGPAGHWGHAGGRHILATWTSWTQTQATNLILQTSHGRQIYFYTSNFLNVDVLMVTGASSQLVHFLFLLWLSGCSRLCGGGPGTGRWDLSLHWSPPHQLKHSPVSGQVVFSQVSTGVGKVELVLRSW